MDGGCGGSQDACKEVNLIMVFSQIIGVSCDGYIEKLKSAFAHIWASKAKKTAKKIVGRYIITVTALRFNSKLLSNSEVYYVVFFFF